MEGLSYLGLQGEWAAIAGIAVLGFLGYRELRSMINAKTDSADVRVAALEKTEAATQERLGHMDERLNRGTGKIDSIEASVGIMQSDIATIKQQTNLLFTHLIEKNLKD